MGSRVWVMWDAMFRSLCIRLGEKSTVGSYRRSVHVLAET